MKKLRALMGDAETMQGFQTKLVLPWEEVSQENAEKI